LLFIDYSWDAEILNCQNQDVQDLRIFRIVICRLFVGCGNFHCLNQDVQDLRIYRIVIDELSVNIER
jgi:hypothetical protein